MAVFLRTNIARKVGCRIGVPILVTIKAGDATARPLRAAILRLIELLLRERRQEEAQPLELLGIEDAAENLVIIVDRTSLP